jgi:uncharacterized membrane protein YhaH (DUF805 family)
MNWYLKVLSNYATFSGRARRKEYWMFVLVSTLISVIALFIDDMLGTVEPTTGQGLVYGIYSLAVFIPGLAVSVRRLHDVGKSGWMLLIAIIPIIGIIWLLVLFVTDSQQGSNEYGHYPKGDANEGIIY